MTRKYAAMVMISVAALFALTLLSSPKAFPEAIIIDHTCCDLSRIPADWINQAKSNLHIAYEHTSHGSQLITGMNALESFPSSGTKYQWSDDGSVGLDLDDTGIPGPVSDLSQGDYIDGNGVTPWVTSTRELLDNPSNYHLNVIVWSWCSINGHNPQRYLDNMEILISEYGEGGSKPRAEQYPVKFVFMTGHAESQGENLYDDPQPDGTGHVHYNNQLIRQHCAGNNRILFDFADIESYDPDGNYFWDLNMADDLDYTGGNWGEEWIDDNPGSELEQLTTGNGVDGYSGCQSCAHCDGPDNKARINCVLKGRAAWWLWARLAGWNGQTGTSTPTPPLPTPTPTVCCVTPTPFFSSIFSGDYDGDGTDDIAIFRSGSGLWGVRGITRIYFGTGHDHPVSGDYDDDGTADIGIFRGSSGIWAIRSVTRVYFGSGSDQPVPFAYNPSSAACRMGIFRGSTGLWAIRSVTRVYFGGAGDRPVPGDYDGDATGELAVFRESSGLWAIRGISRIYFGTDGDKVVPGDYNGNGSRSPAIYRSSAGLWAIRGLTRLYYGSQSDHPVPADYNGDGSSDIVVFRGASGLWALRGITRAYYGSNGDCPVTR